MFDNIFRQHVYLDNVNSLRQSLYSTEFNFNNTLPIEVCYENINKQVLINNRLSVISNNIKYEALFLPYNNNRLYISLCGGGRGDSTYPRFLRWKYLNFIQGNYLCIDDPMYMEHSFNGVMWYYGTKESSYLINAIPIIKQIQNILRIKNENTYFIGSSGGGTAAIYLGNYFDGCTVIAINPQYTLYNYNKHIYNYFKNKLNIDLKEYDILNRNYISLTNESVNYILIENFYSNIDKNQFVDFAKRLNIKIYYGLHCYKNIATWIHYTKYFDPHLAAPTELFFFFLQYVTKLMRKNFNINKFKNISYFLNEILYNDYQKLNKLKDFDKTISDLINIYSTTIENNFPLKRKTTKLKNKADFLINDFDNYIFRLNSIDGDIYIYFIFNGKDCNLKNISFDNNNVRYFDRDIDYLRLKIDSNNFDKLIKLFISNCLNYLTNKN